MTPEQAAALRAPFPPEAIGKLPKAGLLLIPLHARNGDFINYTLADLDDAPLVCGIGKSMACRSVEVDHINRNKLDNRRSNMRLVPHAVNSRNVPSQGGSSQFRGVTWDKKKSIWRAQASHAGKGKHLGYFALEEEAAAAVIAFWRRVEVGAL